MANKIKELTDVLMDEFDENDHITFLTKEMDAGDLALANGYYEQAWDHYSKLYAYKGTTSEKTNYVRSNGARRLCKLMQEIPTSHEFVSHLIKTDPDLVRRSRTKNISNDFARKFIGRKYLVIAADDYNDVDAIVEYALNCVGKGHAKSFVFEYNDRDAQIGLQWANRLVNHHIDQYRAYGYMVRAIYHFARYTKTKSSEEATLFCDNVLEAKREYGLKNEYTLYFYAHMCANPNFQHYNGGKHYNPKEGYKLYCQVVDTAQDPDLVASARNIKNMLETKYPSKIGH